ncbi:MAG TPA: hypothetical protein VJQ55_04530 [Candidatus Binatia bacterium]|nr:hypothetical protein [Candidatus Binatia bacterium]
MNSSRDSNADPALLLLDEIERLLEKLRMLESQLAEADQQSKTTIARLQERMEQLDRLRCSNETEITELRRQVADQERALTGRHEAVTAVELALHERIQSLQRDLARRTQEAEQRATEVEDLRRALTQLSAGLVERRESASRKTASINVFQDDTTFTIETKEQEFAMSMDDKDKALVRGAADAGAVEKTPREQSLRNEVERLLREAQEKNQILQDRNEELVRVKAELDRATEQLNELESSKSEVEITLKDDSARMRTEFQAQLALLQAELSQKEWALEERQAEARGQEHSLRQEIESLRRQLIERKLARHDSDDFPFGEPPAEPFPDSEARPHRYSGSFAEERRWQNGSGWKRRWRTKFS